MPKDLKLTDGQNAKKQERLLQKISSAANSLLMYPSGHPTAERQLDELYQVMAEKLKDEGTIAIHYGEGVLVVNDTQVTVRSNALEKIVEHFNDFKVTDLEINPGLGPDELRRFLELFAHSEETAQMYDELNEACQKNQISNINALQAAYIRVPKNVKDKLGGKSVGEIKISTEEMTRLVSYLKGEVELTDPKELSSYEKIFKNPNILTSLIDKIVVESADLPPEKKKQLVIIVLNRVGNYLSQRSTGSQKQKEAIGILSALNKNLLTDSRTFITLGSDQGFKNEVNQTIDQLKFLVKNQTLVAEYTKHTKKLQELKKKISTIAPQLLTITTGQKTSLPSDLQKLLSELKDFLQKINQVKTLSTDEYKKIASFIEKLNKYLTTNK